MIRIAHSQFLVHDQDAALEFSTRTLRATTSASPKSLPFDPNNDASPGPGSAGEE